MGYDSKNWDWGQGFCRKHRGQELPCRACIDSNDVDVIHEEVLDVSFGNYDMKGETTYIAFGTEEDLARIQAENRLEREKKLAEMNAAIKPITTYMTLPDEETILANLNAKEKIISERCCVMGCQGRSTHGMYCERHKTVGISSIMMQNEVGDCVMMNDEEKVGECIMAAAVHDAMEAAGIKTEFPDDDVIKQYLALAGGRFDDPINETVLRESVIGQAIQDWWMYGFTMTPLSGAEAKVAEDRYYSEGWDKKKPEVLPHQLMSGVLPQMYVPNGWLEDYKPPDNALFSPALISKIKVKTPKRRMKPKFHHLKELKTGEKLGFWGQNPCGEIPLDSAPVGGHAILPLGYHGPAMDFAPFEMKMAEQVAAAITPGSSADFFGLEEGQKLECIYKHEFKEPLVVHNGEELLVTYTLGRTGFVDVKARVEKARPSFEHELVQRYAEHNQRLIDRGATPEQIAEIGMGHAFPKLDLFETPTKHVPYKPGPNIGMITAKDIEAMKPPTGFTFEKLKRDFLSIEATAMAENAFAAKEAEIARTIINLYAQQWRAVDDLPYTEELDRMAAAVRDLAGVGDLPNQTLQRWVYQRLITLRKAGKLPLKS